MSKRMRPFIFRRSMSSPCTSETIPSLLPPPRGEKEWGEGSGSRDEGWSRLLPELLADIFRRIDEASEIWPSRKDVVSCAGVCRRWREAALCVLLPSRLSGSIITFPSSLKQPGPRDRLLQCLIKRNRKNGTFLLYLGLADSFIEQGKFLLAARRFRHGAYTEYIISLDANDLSQGSNAYLGKLRSDFLGTNFTLYDTQAPFIGAKACRNRASRRFASKQISPQVPAGSFVVGQVSYKFNLLKSKGPRRMVCTLECPLPKQASELVECKDYNLCRLPIVNHSVVLKNKAPRWHEHLQCWCLNFHGRVTVASVKNFQLVAVTDPSQPGGRGDEDKVLLQFGKVGDDMFTMDYRQPLSTFQAFAICMTSFGTKLACE